MARQLAEFGHQIKLIPRQFVCSFVEGNKDDFVGAEAICEAASRPSMRCITPKRLPAVLAEGPVPGLVSILEPLHAHFKYLSGQI